MAKNEVEKFDESIIRDRIYSIRGFQVMLDSDLAELYGVETKRINEAVKRNKERFPAGFCFKLKYSEVAEQRSQIATLKKKHSKIQTLCFYRAGCCYACRCTKK